MKTKTHFGLIWSEGNFAGRERVGNQHREWSIVKGEFSQQSGRNVNTIEETLPAETIKVLISQIKASSSYWKLITRKTCQSHTHTHTHTHTLSLSLTHFAMEINRAVNNNPNCLILCCLFPGWKSTNTSPIHPSKRRYFCFDFQAEQEAESSIKKEFIFEPRVENGSNVKN